MKKYTKEEVVELFNEFKSEFTKTVDRGMFTPPNGDKFVLTFYKQQYNDFLKEKGLLKPELEVGKWYKYNSCIFCWDGKKDNDGYVTGYGFSGGTWINRDDNGWGDKECLKIFPATQEEVEEALIKEAKKKYGSSIIKCLHDCDNVSIPNNAYFTYDGFCLRLEGGLDVCCLMDRNGKWAEIIEESKELTIEQIQDKLGYKVKIVE